MIKKIDVPYSETRISELDSIGCDDHCMLLIHDSSLLKRLPQKYAYLQLDTTDAIVAIFPFYRAAGEIKNILMRKGIEMVHHQSQGSLLTGNSLLIDADQMTKSPGLQTGLCGRLPL